MTSRLSVAIVILMLTFPWKKYQRTHFIIKENERKKRETVNGERNFKYKSCDDYLQL